MRKLGAAVVLAICVGAVLSAEDWPEIRGKGRLGVWNETGIVEQFPADGLKVLWRVPIKAGFAGPAVAGGRVFVTDYAETKRPRGIERAIALDEKTGKVLWSHEWEVDYRGMSYGLGPRATPTVDGDRVYFAGADGKLFCLNAATGAVVWKTDFVADFGADRAKWGWDWGFSSAPLVDGPRLIALVGGRPDAKVVAFDKLTGKEIWRALSSESEIGVAQPIIITAGGTRQLIIWYPGAVASLDPATGKVYWEQPYKVGASMTVATPIHTGSLLFFTNFYDGPLMLALDEQKPAATVLWKGKSDNEIQTDGLHATTATPVIVGDYIYGICSYGQFRCLRAKTGERIWETQALTKERGRWVSGQIVRHGDRLFINNDRGDLVIVKPGPGGYEEISRTFLLKPTSPPGNRREMVSVNWSHPAYANRHIYARNDEEIIAASLAAEDGK
jgi:outer membrane protein assembly factor BamB